MEYAIISNYLTYCKLTKRLSPHTIRAYKNDLNAFYHYHSNDVNLYIEHLIKTVQKSNTLKRKIASIKAFCRYLVDLEIIDDNPLQHKRFHFKSEKILPKVIPLSDLKLIFHHLQTETLQANTNYSKVKAHRNWLIFSLLLSTGLRISELCNLTLKQLNIEHRTLSIIGKGKKERVIYLGDPDTVTLLSDYLQNYHDHNSPFLFPGQSPQKPITEQSIRLTTKKLSLDLNLFKSITPHMFRHTFATMLLDNNVDIRQIQHLLGHSSITVTQIYTSVSQNKQKEILTEHNPFRTLQLS